MPALMPPSASEDRALGELRREVRSFLIAAERDGLFIPTVDVWLTGWDAGFSRALAERGWIGMTIPVAHGGRGRSHLERFVVTEELLAAGAPVAAHWIADRQVAPTLLRFGNATLQREYLPRIVAAEVFFGIGMSEPDAGSDLASVRTRATRIDGGWSVTGTKLWTSGGHEADAFIALVRTSPTPAPDASGRVDRHAGLSQLLVRLTDPGVRIRPVVQSTGRRHFNEVVMEDVFVPDDHVVGDLGDGWRQVTSELAFERSGPERFLSTYPLLERVATGEDLADEIDDADLGRHLARAAGLHRMSLSVAAALQRGERPDVAASLVKLLGTTFEGDVAEWADLAAGHAAGDTGALAREAVLQRPGFTLRGGTNEILRGVVARGLGMR